MIGRFIKGWFGSGSKQKVAEKEIPEFEVFRRSGFPTIVTYPEQGKYGEMVLRRTSCTRYIREQLEGMDREMRYCSLRIEYVPQGWSVAVNLYIPLKHGILRCHYDGEFCIYVELRGERHEVILSKEDLDDLRWERRFGHLTTYIDSYYKEMVVEHLKLMAKFSENIRLHGSAFSRELK